MIPTITFINWDDAVTPTSGWTDIKELKPELADCISLGLIIEENDKTITIVSHISGDKEGTDIDGSLVLDKSWIKFRLDMPVPEMTVDKLKKWLLKRLEE